MVETLAQKDQVTILIPSHNRHDMLSVCVSWFLRMGCKIVIVDSTEQQWASPMKVEANITYIHDQSAFDKKILLGLNHVSTPFVAMCADDDFLFASGIDKSIKFLLANNEYVFCQGVPYQFQKLGMQVAFWPIDYEKDINSRNWVDRVTQPKPTCFWGVAKSNVLRESFASLTKLGMIEDSYGGLLDEHLTNLLAKNGYLKFGCFPFSMRNYSLSVDSVGLRYLLQFDTNLPKTLNFMLKQLTSSKSPTKAENERIKRSIAAGLSGQLTYDSQSGRQRSLRFLMPSQTFLKQKIEFIYRLLTCAYRFTKKPKFATKLLRVSPELNHLLNAIKQSKSHQFINHSVRDQN